MSVSARGYYATVWRWHFYAGLFCIPFVLILAFSGAIYLFKPQLESLAESSFHSDSVPAGPRLSANQQINRALAAWPDSRLVRYRLPQHNTEAVRITIQASQHAWYVYVNPYTGNIVGTRKVSQTLAEWMKTLHGQLHLSDNGSLVIELAASWTIILIVTGLYLWWPRSGQGAAGVWYPRLGAGKRRFWLDIHRVTGMWISILALFLLVSGLPWTTVWGSGFQAARSYFAQMQVEQDWSTAPDTKTAPVKNTKSEPEMNLSPPIYRVAVDAALSPPVALSPSTLQPGAWQISSMDPNLPARASVWVDANAAVLKRSEFADNAALDKVILTGIAAHEGQLFGLANQLLGLLTALGLMLLSISGFVMWYKRKPGRQLGAPKSRFYDKGMVALVTGLSLLLPMVLFSILGLLVTEWLILRRVERLRRFFALSERKT